MKGLWCVLFIFLIALQTACAGETDPNDPEQLLRAKWDAIIVVLQNKEMDKKAKEAEITKIISPIFNFPLMSKLALGKKHWPKLTVAQREKYTHLFTERLKGSYAEKISLYTDEQSSFKPAVEKNKTVRIEMELVSREKKIAILYKLRNRDKCWKIYDVEIEGVSILLTYRSQFDDILSHGTVEDLLSQLEKPGND